MIIYKIGLLELKMNILYSINDYINSQLIKITDAATIATVNSILDSTAWLIIISTAIGLMCIKALRLCIQGAQELYFAYKEMKNFVSKKPTEIFFASVCCITLFTKGMEAIFINQQIDVAMIYLVPLPGILICYYVLQETLKCITAICKAVIIAFDDILEVLLVNKRKTVTIKNK